jgi:hypothetical protein
VQVEELLDALADRGQARPASQARRAHVVHPQHEREGGAGQQRSRREQPGKTEVTDDELAGQRRERRRQESRKTVDAERPSPALMRHEVDHVDVVRDEERRERDALQRAQHAEDWKGAGHHEGGARDRQHRYAEHHEEVPAETIDPRADERLAENSRGAVHALDQADGGLAAAELMNVERQQHEAVEAAEEEEVGQHGADERPADQDVVRRVAIHGRPRDNGMTGVMTSGNRANGRRPRLLCQRARERPWP